MTTHKIILHASAAVIIFWGYNGLGRLGVYPEMGAQYGGLWQFLTIQGIYLAGLTMLVSLTLDVFPSIAALKTMKRSLLMLTLPLNFVISLIYWPLVLFSPAMILQKDLSNDSPSSDVMTEMLFYIPLDMDLALHAAPAISLTMDFFLFENKYSRRAANVLAPLLALAYTLWYGWWVERCSARNNGIFPYPFLTDNSFGIRLVIYAGAGLIAPIVFRFFNKWHWHNCLKPHEAEDLVLRYMPQTRPLPGHPEFSVIDYPGFREYRVENFYLARGGSGNVMKKATGFSGYWAVSAVCLGLAQGYGQWWLSFWALIAAILLYAKFTQVVNETILVIPRHGVQIETHRGLPGCVLFASRRFIPLPILHDIIINEGLRGWDVRYYLAIAVAHPVTGFSLDVAFENVLPRMPVLLEVYHGIRDLLLSSSQYEGEEALT